MLRAPVVKNDQRSASQNALHIHSYTHAARFAGARARAAAKTIHLCHAPQLHNQFSIRLQTRKNRARRLY
jgi:hypothetical protein